MADSDTESSTNAVPLLQGGSGLLAVRIDLSRERLAIGMAEGALIQPLASVLFRCRSETHEEENVVPHVVSLRVDLTNLRNWRPTS